MAGRTGDAKAICQQLPESHGSVQFQINLSDTKVLDIQLLHILFLGVLESLCFAYFLTFESKFFMELHWGKSRVDAQICNIARMGRETAWR